MTISQLVDRERASLRRLHVVAGVVIALALTASIVAVATVGLGGARWMTLPRVTPFAVWAAVIAANAGAWSLTRYVLRRGHRSWRGLHRAFAQIILRGLADG